ncbi:MAG: ABC transporter ATP-binding protein [Phycisphaeraceae bacterium]
MNDCSDNANDAADAPHMVQLVNVSKSFGALHVLRGVTLDVPRGQTTVILGPSGTGKSVLLKLIVGLLKPDAGEIYCNNRRVDTMPPAELVEARKEVGFLFQMGALFDSMSVEENVAFPLVEHTRLSTPERRERVRRVLEMVGLADTLEKMPSELSGGQRKRVALARAIVLEPCLVLYDEPTTGLDPIRSDVINELINELRRHLGVTSIVVTHDVKSALKIADRMVLLYDGRIVCEGEPETFRRTDNQTVQRFLQGRADDEDLASIRRGFERAEEGGRFQDQESGQAE